MKSIASLLILLLTSSQWLLAQREEPRIAHKEDRAKPRTAPRPTHPEAKDPKKQAPHSTDARAGQDPTARLKALEQENQRLRQELASKNGAASSLPGPESISPEGALVELKAGNARFARCASCRRCLWMPPNPKPATDPGDPPC